MWNHATSDNMLNWQRKGTIIRGYWDPQPTFYRGKQLQNVSMIVPFAGSVIVDSRNSSGLMRNASEPVLLLYTSLSKFLLGTQDPVRYNQMFIYSAVSLFYTYDGDHYYKYERPLINYSETIRDFRDPNVFRFNDSFYMIMIENMEFAIHRSSDLINFEKVSNFDPAPYIPSDIIEVETPYLVTFGNDTFLIYSSHHNLPEFNNTERAYANGVYHHFLYGTTRYIVGTFDGVEFRPHANNQSREFDGPDLYALSVNVEEKILMGTMNNWKYSREIPYNGSLSYPRRLGKMTVNNQTYLTQQFIRLEAFGDERLDSRDQLDEEVTYAFTVNRPHHIRIGLTNFECNENCDFKLKFEDPDRNNTMVIGYEHARNEFYLDRSRSIQVDSCFNDVHKFKGKYQKLLSDDRFDIDIVLDTNTIELLTDNGAISFTILHVNHRIFETLSIVTNKNYKADLRVASYES